MIPGTTVATKLPSSYTCRRAQSLLGRCRCRAYCVLGTRRRVQTHLSLERRRSRAAAGRFCLLLEIHGGLGSPVPIDHKRIPWIRQYASSWSKIETLHTWQTLLSSTCRLQAYLHELQHPYQCLHSFAAVCAGIDALRETPHIRHTRNCESSNPSKPC